MNERLQNQSEMLNYSDQNDKININPKMTSHLHSQSQNNKNNRTSNTERYSEEDKTKFLDGKITKDDIVNRSLALGIKKFRTSQINKFKVIKSNEYLLNKEAKVSKDYSLQFNTFFKEVPETESFNKTVSPIQNRHSIDSTRVCWKQKQVENDIVNCNKKIFEFSDLFNSKEDK